MIRQIFLSIGKNFVTDERILSQSDIFYLSYEDILEGIKDNSYNLKRIIVKRKREYRRYKALPEYTRLVFNDKIINKQPLNIKIDEADFDEHILMGIPCSTGIVEGEVVVIDDPKNYKNIKYKILVTKMTDPGWVFLLTRAKGIVAEKGSLLSHTAIISRELRKPSVVGVDNITNILKTGDRIKLNGNTGEIEIL
jgi:pyruvate,water dikinase